MRKLLTLTLLGLCTIFFAERSQLKERENTSRIQFGQVDQTAPPSILSQQAKRLKVIRDPASVEYWFVRVQNDRSRIPLAGFEEIQLTTLRTVEVTLGDRLNNTARVSLPKAFPGARVYRIPERELTKHFGPQIIPVTGSQAYEMVEPTFRVKCSVQRFYYAPVPHSGWFGPLPVGRAKSPIIYINEPVECYNTCGCTGCMTCTATHTWDGTVHPTIMPLDQYLLEPEVWHSCNSRTHNFARVSVNLLGLMLLLTLTANAQGISDKPDDPEMNRVQSMISQSKKEAYYLLDREGRIAAKDIPFKKLGAAIDDLLKK